MTSFAVPTLDTTLAKFTTPKATQILAKAVPILRALALKPLPPQVLIPVLAVGAVYVAGMTIYNWSQSQQVAIQEKAVALKNTLTEGQEAKAYNVEGEATFYFGSSSEGPDFTSRIFSIGQVYGPIQAPVIDTTPFGGFGWNNPLGFNVVGDNGATTYPLKGQSFNPPFTTYHGPNYYTNNRLVSAKITKITPVDGVFSNSSSPLWKDLTPAQQQQALDQLSNEDWEDALKTTSGTLLQPGETIVDPMVLTGDSADINSDPITFTGTTTVSHDIPISNTGSDPSDTSTKPYSIPVYPTSVSNPGEATDPATGTVTPASAANPANVGTKSGAGAIPAGQRMTIPFSPSHGITVTPTANGGVDVEPYGTAPALPKAEPVPKDITLPDLWKQVQDIKSALPFIAPAVALTMAPALANTMNPTQTRSAAAAGTCDVMSGTSPCAGSPLSNMNKGIGGANSKLDDLIQGLGLGTQAGIGALLGKVDKTTTETLTKVTSMTSKVTDVWNRTAQVAIDKVMTAMIYVTVLHNAYMLSADLGRTLFSLTGNALAAIGFKNEDGSAIDVGATIGSQIDAIAVKLFGVTTWKGIKAEWAKYNRVYQAGANIASSLSSISQANRSIAEFGAGQVGKIGNALKRDGVVREDAYAHMPERVNAGTVFQQKMDRVVDGISSINDAASSLESVTSDVLSIQEEVKSIQEQAKTFTKSVDDGAKDVSDKAKASSHVSQPPSVSEADEKAD